MPRELDAEIANHKTKERVSGSCAQGAGLTKRRQEAIYFGFGVGAFDVKPLGEKRSHHCKTVLLRNELRFGDTARSASSPLAFRPFGVRSQPSDAVTANGPMVCIRILLSPSVIGAWPRPRSNVTLGLTVLRGQYPSALTCCDRIKHREFIAKPREIRLRDLDPRCR